MADGTSFPNSQFNGDVTAEIDRPARQLAPTTQPATTPGPDQVVESEGGPGNFRGSMFSGDAAAERRAARNAQRIRASEDLIEGEARVIGEPASETSVNALVPQDGVAASTSTAPEMVHLGKNAAGEDVYVDANSPEAAAHFAGNNGAAPGASAGNGTAAGSSAHQQTGTTPRGRASFRERMAIRRSLREARADLRSAQRASVQADRAATAAARRAPLNWEEANGPLQRVSNGGSRRLNAQTNRAMHAQQTQRTAARAQTSVDNAEARLARVSRIEEATRPEGFLARTFEGIADSPVGRFAGAVARSPVARFIGRIAEPLVGATAGLQLGHTLGTDKMGENIGRRLGGENGARIGHAIGKWAPAVIGGAAVAVGAVFAAVPTAIVVGAATCLSVDAVLAHDAWHAVAPRVMNRVRADIRAHGGYHNTLKDNARIATVAVKTVASTAWHGLQHAVTHPLQTLGYMWNALGKGLSFQPLNKDYWAPPKAAAPAPAQKPPAKPAPAAARQAPRSVRRAAPTPRAAPVAAATVATTPAAAAAAPAGLPQNGAPQHSDEGDDQDQDERHDTGGASALAALGGGEGASPLGAGTTAVAAGSTTPTNLAAPSLSTATVQTQPAATAPSPLNDATKTQIAAMVQDMKAHGADTMTIQGQSAQDVAAFAAEARRDGFTGNVVTNAAPDPTGDVVGRYSFNTLKSDQARNVTEMAAAAPENGTTQTLAPASANPTDGVRGSGRGNMGALRSTTIADTPATATTTTPTPASPNANVDQKIVRKPGTQNSLATVSI